MHKSVFYCRHTLFRPVRLIRGTMVKANARPTRLDAPYQQLSSFVLGSGTDEEQWNETGKHDQRIIATIAGYPFVF